MEKGKIKKGALCHAIEAHRVGQQVIKTSERTVGFSTTGGVLFLNLLCEQAGLRRTSALRLKATGRHTRSLGKPHFLRDLDAKVTCWADTAGFKTGWLGKAGCVTSCSLRFSFLHGLRASICVAQ